MSPLVGRRVVGHYNPHYGGVVLAVAYDHGSTCFQLLLQDDRDQLVTGPCDDFRVVVEPPPGVEQPSDGIPVPFA